MPFISRTWLLLPAARCRDQNEHTQIKCTLSHTPPATGSDPLDELPLPLVIFPFASLSVHYTCRIRFPSPVLFSDVQSNKLQPEPLLFRQMSERVQSGVFTPADILLTKSPVCVEDGVWWLWNKDIVLLWQLLANTLLSAGLEKSQTGWQGLAQFFNKHWFDEMQKSFFEKKSIFYF